MKDIIIKNLLFNKDFVVNYGNKEVKFVNNGNTWVLGFKDGIEMFKENISDIPLRLLGELIDLLCEKEGTIIM